MGVNLIHDHKIKGMQLTNNNLTIGNPMSPHGGSGSSISVGASTILAASLERESQRTREREQDRENCDVSVGNISCRVSAIGRSEIDTLPGNDLSSDRAFWNNEYHRKDNGFITRGKKLSWETSQKVILISKIF